MPPPGPRLPEPGSRSFLLACEAHRAGSLGVGAVRVDPAGAVIATGRNRSAEVDAPSGRLAGSYLAHAEVNALLGLAPGDYEQHVLYITPELGLLRLARDLRESAPIVLHQDSLAEAMDVRWPRLRQIGGEPAW